MKVSPTLTCRVCVHSDDTHERAICQECVGATVSQGFFNEASCLEVCDYP